MEVYGSIMFYQSTVVHNAYDTRRSLGQKIQTRRLGVSSGVDPAFI
jgi:hypothetical protein